jgi:hypothetical protein
MRRSLAALAATVLVACGGSGPTDPGGGGGGGNALSATIDGTAWSASSATINAAGNMAQLPGGLLFTGSTITQPARGLIIQLGRISGPGSYPLGVNTATNAGGTITMSLGSSGWSTPLNGDAGSITISSMANGRVQGTFSATLERTFGADGAAQVSITNGQFNVPINPGHAAPAADNRGSTLSVTVDGQSSKGATIVGIGGGTSLIGITASNLEWTVILTAGPVDGQGTLPLSPVTVPIRKVSIMSIGSGQGWGGTQADVGTFTISSITATRMAGTYSAVLAGIGQAGGARTVTGTFDVRTVP